MTMELDGRPVTVDDLGALALYNYGHFTSMRVEKGFRVRGLSLHMERLSRDCKILFDAEMDQQRVRYFIRRVVENSRPPVIVRVTVFDPELDLGHPGINTAPHVLVSTRPAVATTALPPLRLKAVRYERDLPAVKHVGLFGTLYLRRAAQLGSFDDVVFTDARSQIAEGATWNIGFIDRHFGSSVTGHVLWPRSDVLPGVTMQLVEDILSEMGVGSTSVDVSVSQVGELHAAFATNAAIGVRAVASIDDFILSTDTPIIASIQRNYDVLQGEAL
jgi:branched-subunit amino acid aminotransferase/4-amino-4-deoxychorismate lyase